MLNHFVKWHISTFTFWPRSVHSLYSMMLVFNSSVMKVTMTERSLSLNHMAGKVMGGGRRLEDEETKCVIILH